MPDTVGKLSSDLIIKQHDDTHSAEEQMREQLEDYDRNIYECIEIGKKNFPGDFFVVVITKKERLLPNVIRNYFTSRISCPTPEYDQTVYKVLRRDEIIEFLWVVPSKQTCNMMRRAPLEVPKEEKQLLQFVLDFEDNTLLELSKKLNGEKPDAVITLHS